VMRAIEFIKGVFNFRLDAFVFLIPDLFEEIKSK
jgi:hypothetical protein